MVGTGTIDLECPVDNGQWTRSSRGQCNNPLVASFVLGQYPVVGGLGTRGRRMLNFSKTISILPLLQLVFMDPELR